MHQLTTKEKEIVQSIAKGKTGKEIAMELKICVGTIHTYRRRAMAKLNVDSNAELTKYAIREELIKLEV